MCDKDTERIMYRFYRKIAENIEKSYLLCVSRKLVQNDLDTVQSVVGDKLYSKPKVVGEDIVERGPKIWICSEWGSNAKAVLEKCGLDCVVRIERFTRGSKKVVSKGVDQMVEQLYDNDNLVTQFTPENVELHSTHVEMVECDLQQLKDYSEQHFLGFTDEDIEWYYKMWANQDRKFVTELELHDLAQSNSEHSRHHIFRGTFHLENKAGTYASKYPHTLFGLVRRPLEKLQETGVGVDNSVLAFCDNSSAISGFETVHLHREEPMKSGSNYLIKGVNTNTLFTAETHNFPTGIAPFPGAATGTGGRIRDVQAIGRGGQFVAGTAGYCVGSLGLDSLKDIEDPLPQQEYLHSGRYILTQASNGASDYGNKIGEPIIQGFTRSFGATIDDSRVEWMKPIMFTSGIGIVYSEHLEKKQPETGMLIARVGGPAYRIGVGGGTASSTSQDTGDTDAYQSSVQRGDPEMEQKLDRFLRACIEMGDDNPIVSIHDQGAGGMCNVTKEIVETDTGSKGAIIDIRKVVCGDETMTLKELWIAEYQEQNTFLCRRKDTNTLKQLAEREGVSVAFVGTVTNDGIFTVHDTLAPEAERPIVEFKLNELSGLPRRSFVLPYVDPTPETLESVMLKSPDNKLLESLWNVIQHPSVCSKRFLTNKVDRSVTGLIAQQQCVGPLHTPLADVAIIAHSYFGREGAATAIGERPTIGIVSPDKMARMAVGEMVTNLMWVKTSGGLRSVKCSGNWMWPAKDNVEKRKMLLCAKALSDVMCDLGLSIDGGKDSLSMSSTQRVSGERVDCPPQLVISGYTSVKDVTKKVTPDLKTSGNGLIYINVFDKYRLGGSILVQTLHADSGMSGFFQNDYPDMDDPLKFESMFEAIQLLVKLNYIESGHDISDGGMITTVLEMAFAGNKGVKINIDTSEALCTDERFKKCRWLSVLFAEELGCVIEVPYKHIPKVKKILSKASVSYQYIGYVTNQNSVTVKLDNEPVIDQKLTTLRSLWEHTSFEMEMFQANPNTVIREKENLKHEYPERCNRVQYGFHCTDKVWESLYSDNYNNVSLRNSFPNRPRVAIIREEGSNGDREMCAAWWSAGFEPYDIMTSDMVSENSTVDLKNFHGIVFVGGFTFSDVFGAAKGWQSIIQNNDRVKKQFDWFYSNANTTRFSLGVCNGCQLMCRMGWVGKPFEGENHVPIPETNESNRFESRFAKIKIIPSKSVLLNGMAGCTIGVWVAHGEGRFGSLESRLPNHIDPAFPLRYVDDEISNLMYTNKYPDNPNGSVYGIAGAISKNGLHLAMMPHPERTTKSWQNPWYPKEWQPNIDASYDGMSMPWSKLFKNGYEFVQNK